MGKSTYLKPKKVLECDFCHKSFKGKTTAEARHKRLIHVINDHGQMSNDESVDSGDLIKIADILAPEEENDAEV